MGKQDVSPAVVAIVIVVVALGVVLYGWKVMTGHLPFQSSGGATGPSMMGSSAMGGSGMGGSGMGGTATGGSPMGGSQMGGPPSGAVPNAAPQPTTGGQTR